MKRVPGDVINTGSLVLLVFIAIAEIELYTMGHSLVKAAGRGAWLSVIIGGLVSNALLYFIIKLTHRFPRKTFFEYTPLVWGRFLTYPLIAIYLLYWLIWLVRMMWRVGDINVTFFLPNTPLIVILAMFLVGAISLASYGIVPISRFFEFMLLFYFVPSLIIYILALGNIQLSYFFPIFDKGVRGILKGAVVYSCVFQGLEIVLFAVPFTKEPQKTYLPAVCGLSLVHIVVLLEVISLIGNLGAHSTSELIYPAIEMLGTLHLPGWPVERFELMLTLPWLIGVFTSVALTIYLISQGLQKLLNLKNSKLLYWAVGLSCIPLVYLIPDILWAGDLDNLLSALTPFLIYILPLSTYLLAVVRGKKGVQGNGP